MYVHCNYRFNIIFCFGDFIINPYNPNCSAFGVFCFNVEEVFCYAHLSLISPQFSSKKKTSFFLLYITVVDLVVFVECPTVVIQIHHVDGAVAAAANVGGVGGVVLDCYC